MSPSSTFRCCVMFIAVSFPFVVIAYAFYLMNTSQRPAGNALGTRAVPSLEFVVVVSRHGNRRPLYSFPNEPYPDKFWSCELGELTRQGKLQMFNLGKKIRSLYNGFLKISYSSKDFHATSTIKERTLVSAEAFTAGLYPPSGDQIWKEDMPWQPIPIYTDSPDNSQIGHYPCPRYENETYKAVGKVFKDNADLIKNVTDYLDKYTGDNSSVPALYIFKVWDSLSTDKIEGLVLPEWTKPVYPKPLSTIMNQESVALCAGSDAITKIISSAIFIQIVGLLEGKINGTLTPDYKMYYYSSHDLTLISLQAVLGIPKTLINGLVNPSSALIFELHRDAADNRFVKVLFIDGLSSDLRPVAVNVTQCHDSCTFSQLLDVTAKFRNFTSVHDECFNMK